MDGNLRMHKISGGEEMTIIDFQLGGMMGIPFGMLLGVILWVLFWNWKTERDLNKVINQAVKK